MLKYSFLSESRKQFFKALRRYKPEDQRSIMKRLIDSGSELDAEEYGRRLYIGHMKRLGALSKKYNRRVGVDYDSNPSLWGVYPTKFMYGRSELQNSLDTKKGVNVATSGKDLIVVPKLSDPNYTMLQKADAVAHEVDEFDQIMRLSNGRKMTPEEVVVRTICERIPHTPPNVLNRERDRRALLKTMYQYNPIRDRLVPELLSSRRMITDEPIPSSYNSLLAKSLEVKRLHN